MDAENMITEENIEQDREPDKEPDTGKNDYEESERSEGNRKTAEDLIGNYKGLLEKEKEGYSSVEQLQEILENWGMLFKQSSIQNSVIINNQNIKEREKKKAGQKNILGTMDDQKILKWASEHYKDWC